jgi:hypothetical protein
VFVGDNNIMLEENILQAMAFHGGIAAGIICIVASCSNLSCYSTAHTTRCGFEMGWISGQQSIQIESNLYHETEGALQHQKNQ